MLVVSGVATKPMQSFFGEQGEANGIVLIAHGKFALRRLLHILEQRCENVFLVSNKKWKTSVIYVLRNPMVCRNDTTVTGKIKAKNKLLLFMVVGEILMWDLIGIVNHWVGKFFSFYRKSCSSDFNIID